MALADLRRHKSPSFPTNKAGKALWRGGFIAVLLALLFTGAEGNAQTIDQFSASGLLVGGGETTLSNNTAVIYRGLVNILPSGSMYGRIERSTFAGDATNSRPSIAQVDITKSKVFGPVVLARAVTNNTSWRRGAGTRRIDRFYAADFHIATSLPGFFVKGRATQQLVTIIQTNVYAGPPNNPGQVLVGPPAGNNGGSASLSTQGGAQQIVGPSPGGTTIVLQAQESIVNRKIVAKSSNLLTNVITNFYRYVSLDGVSFRTSQGTKFRGMFDAGSESLER